MAAMANAVHPNTVSIFEKVFCRILPCYWLDAAKVTRKADARAEKSLTIVLHFTYILSLLRSLGKLVFFAPLVDDIHVGLPFQTGFHTTDKRVEGVFGMVFLGPQCLADGFPW